VQIPCEQGNLQGISPKLALGAQITDSDTRKIPMPTVVYQVRNWKFPTRTEQGINSAEQGICRR